MCHLSQELERNRWKTGSTISWQIQEIGTTLCQRAGPSNFFVDFKKTVRGSNFTRVYSLPRKINFDMLQGRKALYVIIMMENTYSQL